MKLSFKRFICLTLALIMALSLCACRDYPQEPVVSNSVDSELSVKEETKYSDLLGDDNDDEPSGEGAINATVSQQFSNDAGTSIDVLREEIGDTTALFGVAYIGYFDSAAAGETGIDFGQWYFAASSPLAAYYPFVSEIDEGHTVGTQGHLYCIIARDYETSITVNSLDNEEVLYYAENGDPILLLCSRDGNAQNADAIVTVTTADGSVYRWEPTLDEIGHPQLLIGDEREILFWDFTRSGSDTEFDPESWLAEGWLGPMDIGLANDENGMNWWFSSWDDSVSYCLSFYINESNSYDGEVVLECFYADNIEVQAQWQGWWRIETETDQPSRLYIDMALMNGADMTAFESSTTVSESYLAMVHPSGDYLLLVADDVDTTALPIFLDGVQAVELTRADG